MQEGVKICSTCKRETAREGQRQCGACHRDYMKTWRKRKAAEFKKLIEELRLLRAKSGGRRATV